jgi:rod shape-determining protein MreC
VVTLSSDSRPIIGRGPPLGARFFFLAVVSITIMVLDHRSGYMEQTRSWLQTGMTPLYSVVEMPFQLWEWLTGSFSDRSRLRAENTKLTDDLRSARVKLLRFDALTEENRRLRAIRNASQGIGERTLIAEIVRIDVDAYRHRARINKGTEDGVFKGQPVLDAFGIVGQVTQVDRVGAEIIMISDNEHAIPVQVNRNGIRSIAVGTGDIHRLSLPFLTAESDVKPDDLLVSSGLDGIFPAGYPVATITKVERDPAETFAVVEAKPLAQLDRSREVLLLWFERSTEKPASAPQKPAPATVEPATTQVPAEGGAAPRAPSAPTSAPTSQAPAPAPAPERND